MRAGFSADDFKTLDIMELQQHRLLTGHSYSIRLDRKPDLADCLVIGHASEIKSQILEQEQKLTRSAIIHRTSKT